MDLEAAVWEERCNRIFKQLERAQRNADMRMDLPKLIDRLDENTRGYLELVVKNGVISDPDAAKFLALDEEELEETLAHVEGFIASLEDY